MKMHCKICGCEFESLTHRVCAKCRREAYLKKHNKYAREYRRLHKDDKPDPYFMGGYR